MVLLTFAELLQVDVARARLLCQSADFLLCVFHVAAMFAVAFWVANNWAPCFGSLFAFPFVYTAVVLMDDCIRPLNDPSRVTWNLAYMAVLCCVCNFSFVIGLDTFRYYSLFLENKFIELRSLFAGLYVLFTIIIFRLLYQKLTNKNGGLFINSEQQMKGNYL